MLLFDAHCHLNDEWYDEDRDNLIEEIKKEVPRLISSGYDLESSKYAIELTHKYDFIYTTIGISPNDVKDSIEDADKDIKEIENMLIEDRNSGSSKIVGIGEIGLDYHYNTENKDIQKYYFVNLIKLANKYDLPIVIHTREAVSDTLEILKENEVINKGAFHCCPLNRELVKEGLKLGFYISFCGPVTFKNSKNANEIIEMVPDDRFTIETDSPYLCPEPKRGQRNDPRNVRYIAEKVAFVKRKDISEIAKIAYNNANKLYKIED